MIFILTGPVNSGKTTFLKRVVKELKRQKFRVDGFLSEALWENEEKIGYNLFDLRSEKSITYIRRSGRRVWERIGPYFFTPQGINWAKKAILQSREADIFVVDEIGPLELSGKGLWPALEKIIFERAQNFLFVVRKSILDDFLDVLSKSKKRIFDIENGEVFPPMVEEIRRYCMRGVGS